MFDKLTYNSINDFKDVGLLAESLLFYQKTHLIITRNSLPQLITRLGYNNIIELIDSGALELSFTNEFISAGTPDGSIYMINPMMLMHTTKEEELEKSISSLDIDTGDNFVLEINNRVNEHNYEDPYGNILHESVTDFEEFKKVIQYVQGGSVKLEEIEFESKLVEPAFYDITTNVDSDTIRNAAFLISAGDAMLYNSVKYSSEILVDETLLNYSTNKLNRIIQKRGSTEEKMDNFHRFKFSKFYDLKSTINSGSKTFNDFMDLWRKSNKFKKWLKNADSSEELLSNYITELEKTTWYSELPAKFIRWALFTGIGYFVGNEVGAKVGTAINNFIVEKAIADKDYKPNMFIENEYKQFLQFGI